MSERQIKFVEGESYHIYNRGNAKSTIFHDAQDYIRFQKILFICNGTKKFKIKDLLKYEKDIYKHEKGENLVDIFAYVLMPNHFHIFLTPNKDKAKRTDNNLDNNISVFLKRLTGAYSRYYNNKYCRSGSLFEGKFKAELVDDGNYFKYLFAYIHLNPVKLLQKDWKDVGIKDFPKVNSFLQSYQFSSFPDYFTPGQARGCGGIINKKKFLSQLPEDTDLNKEIFDWLKFKTIEID